MQYIHYTNANIGRIHSSALPLTPTLECFRYRGYEVRCNAYPSYQHQLEYTNLGVDKNMLNLIEYISYWNGLI